MEKRLHFVKGVATCEEQNVGRYTLKQVYFERKIPQVV
jgi:hypothetical protein